MAPSPPNDLAFFYLYDYTSPLRHRRRTHRRHASCHSPCPTAHLEKAAKRRTLHLEAKRKKVATHNANIRNALAQYKLDGDSSKRLEELLDRMARADINRDRLLKLTAENCGRKVEEAKIKAKRVQKERDEIARVAQQDMALKLQMAEKRREELLSSRGRSPTKRPVSNQAKIDAAIKIQRVWRQQRVLRAMHDFEALRISIDSVKSESFEQVVFMFKSAETLGVAARLLTVLGLIKSELPQKETDNVVRTFLSAYMVLGHTVEVLHTHDHPLAMVPITKEDSNLLQDLIQKARIFLETLEQYDPTQRNTLPSLWETYVTTFREWKSHDASILVDLLVTKFVELDLMLLDIQESASMAAVIEEYSTAIKSGQMLLLSKIRKLVGDDTRNIVRRAVQAGRRHRQQRIPVTVEQQEEEQQVITAEIIEPPSFSNGLSNRRIMHELALNPEYEISHERTEEERLREDQFKVAFFAGLESSLKSKDQSLIPTVLKDIKSRLLSLLQPSTPSYIMLSEYLDETIVLQQCQRGIFDLSKFVGYVHNIMRQLCAPARDTQVNEIMSIAGTNEINTFVQQITRINEVLGVMALDSANFHLRLARPALLGQVIEYERSKFAQDIEKGDITLESTKEWIRSASQSYQSEQHRESTSISAQIIVRHAFIETLFSDSDVFPETLSFDITRIHSLRSQLPNLITLAALILVSKTFTAGNTSKSFDWSLLSSRLSILQSDSPENILVEIERFIGSPLLKRDLLLSMIRRVQSDREDPCVSLLTRRVKTVLMNVINGGNVSGLNAIGLSEVEGNLRDIAKSVQSIAKVNWSCYREWYETIIKDCEGQE